MKIIVREHYSFYRDVEYEVPMEIYPGTDIPKFCEDFYDNYYSKLPNKVVYDSQELDGEECEETHIFEVIESNGKEEYSILE